MCGEIMARKRYPLPDTFRGVLLVAMVLYHLTWDLVHLHDVPWMWFLSDGAKVWQQIIAWSFVLLSGFCWPLGKSKWRRGLVVSAGGWIITAVTLLVIPTERVVFGVLTFLGAAMLAMIPLDKLLRHCNPVVGMLCSLACFVLLRNVSSGYLGFGTWNLLKLPEGWYANIVTTFFGFPTAAFFSRDYFPFLPWIFLFCTGYFMQKLFARYHLDHVLTYGKCPPLEFLGRHSLIIYMVHQPILYGLCAAWFAVFG